MVQPARHRHLSQTRIGWSDPDPSCDCFAPAPKRCACQDGAGYWRKRHAYVIERADGRHCCWCDKLESWAQAKGRESKAAAL